jgi:GNAT superfamily N-acetyltransferase
MGELKIRKATPEDAVEMLRLIRELAEYEDGLNQVTMTEDELIQDGFGELPLYECIVADTGTELKGIAIYYYAFSTWNGKVLYLEDLIISRANRIRGLGTKLMNEILEIAKKEKVKRLSWQVLDWNLDAHDFYRKFGASLDTEWLNGRMDERQINTF